MHRKEVNGTLAHPFRTKKSTLQLDYITPNSCLKKFTFKQETISSFEFCSTKYHGL